MCFFKLSQFDVDIAQVEQVIALMALIIPFARKIELAEEFRQIGDLEGARDLLEEVLGKAEGALKNKAQVMLDKLP